MEPDSEVLQKSSVEEELKPASTADVKMQERDQKYIKMWQLMYKHAVLSNAGKSENKVPLDGKDKEEKEKDAIEFNVGDSSSCDNYCETDQDMDDENKNVIELAQMRYSQKRVKVPEKTGMPQHPLNLLRKHRGWGLHLTEEHQKAGAICKKLLLLKRFVKAFREVLPFQDAENGSQTSATVEPQTNPIQCLDDSSGQSKEETDKGRDYGYSAKILLRKALSSHNSTMEFSDNAGDNPMPELHSPIVLKERYLEHPETKTPKDMPASGAIEDDLNGTKVQPTVMIMGRRSQLTMIIFIISWRLISNLNTENPNIKSESTERDFESKNVIGDDREELSTSKSLLLNGLVRSLRSNLVGSGAPSNLLDESTVDRTERTEKAKLETETPEEIPTHQQSETPKSAVVGPETQPEKQSYAGLWFMVYKHMVSDLAENNSKSLNDGADEKESGYEGSRTRGSSITYESTHVIDQDHAVTDPEVELHKIEAIKMVEEAIDSILPDDQDHLPDRQSLTQNSILDNSEQSSRTERMYSEGLNQKEERMESGNGITQDEKQEPAPKEGNKPNHQLSRSWSNLRKVILLRRFIKALEKVRKFNPRGPRYLPIEPDSEAEKVNLRHQDMEERKGTEEWMLDYALRQVVSKLTPARKRKVELLVEAFETVIPTIRN
ncbi:Calmodulin-binding domain, plant [Sesbania bispinosa]|nr:Calmodulin-binding domain, plant [Sesbania bispinosa]